MISDHMGNIAYDLSNYAELIAKDILLQYLTEDLKVVRQSLMGKDYQKDIMDKLYANIDKAINAVQKIQTKNHQDLQDVLGLIEQSRHIESEVSSNLSEKLKNNLTFGDN